MKVLAKKSLGQHFLRDRNAIQRIIDFGRIGEDDQVMEIGPGPGALTNTLREMPCQKLWLLEKDDNFAQKHAEYAQNNKKEHMQIYHIDALTFPWKDLEGKWKILGNLPYNVASPMMWDIVAEVPQLEIAVFMIQKEVAERIRAGEGSKTYGALSVWMQSFCKVEKGFVVSPNAFSPPPKVDSEVIVLKPLPIEQRPQDPKNLARLIKICFQQRRKQLQGILQKALPQQYYPEVWDDLGLAGSSRAETLSPKQFQKLCALLFKN